MLGPGDIDRAQRVPCALSPKLGSGDMETSSLLQHPSRSLWAEFPPGQRPDRLKPIAAPLRRSMPLLGEEPTDTLACSTVAARLASIESFGSTPNSEHPSSMPACGRRLP